MLVLSRKSGECVRVGKFIEVKVLELSAGRVKLGFTAPANMDIQRNEIRAAHPRRGQPTAWEQCLEIAEVCAS
jgi:carbon storage regulator CsrA